MAASRLWDRQGGHEDRTVHLIGAAGSGMRSLARVLHQRGWVLTGSDADARAVDRLRKAAGSPFARLFAWHDAENLPPECGLVIASDAIGRDNPERLVAQRRGLPVLSYTDALGRLMQGDTRGLAVAGTHGKSTTTAMAAHVLIASGKDPTVVCGAATLGQLDGGRAGRGQSVLIEACEYRANFLKLHPRHAVLLGIEPDHFDCYPTLASLEAAFAQFVGQLPPDGLLLARADCPVTRRILTRETPCPVETFALDGPADWTVGRVESNGGRYRFDVVRRGEAVCRVGLTMPGRHNVLNALAAAALCWHQGVRPDQIGMALSLFPGLHRRQEVLGDKGGVLWMDDYAHHPTEVRVTLATVRQMAPGRRLLCVFQPHQASRTRRLLDELAESLHNVDMLWIASIFRAREGAPRPGEATSAELAECVRQHGTLVSRVHDWQDIVSEVSKSLLPGDVFITIGAGDIRRMADELHERIRTVRAAG